MRLQQRLKQLCELGITDDQRSYRWRMWYTLREENRRAVYSQFHIVTSWSIDAVFGPEARVVVGAGYVHAAVRVEPF